MNIKTEWNALGKLLGFIGQAAFYVAAFYGVVIAAIALGGR